MHQSGLGLHVSCERTSLLPGEKQPLDRRLEAAEADEPRIRSASAIQRSISWKTTKHSIAWKMQPTKFRIPWRSILHPGAGLTEGGLGRHGSIWPDLGGCGHGLNQCPDGYRHYKGIQGLIIQKNNNNKIKLKKLNVLSNFHNNLAIRAMIQAN